MCYTHANFACTNVRAEPFYVHENQYTQILNLSSPGLASCISRFCAFCCYPLLLFVCNFSILFLSFCFSFLLSLARLFRHMIVSLGFLLLLKISISSQFLYLRSCKLNLFLLLSDWHCKTCSVASSSTLHIWHFVNISCLF